MKSKLKEYELTFIAVCTAITIGSYLWDAYQIQNKKVANIFQEAFLSRNIPFSFYKNTFFPQLCSVLLFFGCYILVNLLVLPTIKKLLVQRNRMQFIKWVTIISAELFVTAFTLSIGINILSHIAHPGLVSYRSFYLMTLLGYNNGALDNLWFGIDRAFILIGVFLAIASIREFLINIIQKERKTETDYIISTTNQIAGFLLIYFIIPLLLNSFGFKQDFFYRVYFCYLPPILIIFLFNNYWLFPFYAKARFFNFRLISGLLCTSLIIPLIFLSFSTHGDILPIIFFVWLFFLFVVTPLSWLWFQQNKNEILKLNYAKSEMMKSKSDLQFLRTQINPHFLFNTLNTLYGSALLENASKTAESIQILGDMMRFMLHDNNAAFIPISREIEYLNNYLSLQKLRIQNSPDIVIIDEIKHEECNAMIVPMLLIPFVENAFKYGISLTAKSIISFTLRCDRHLVEFYISNSIHPKLNDTFQDEQLGTGIENVKKRLKLLYDGRYDLIIKNDGNRFAVSLKLEL